MAFCNSTRVFGFFPDLTLAESSRFTKTNVSQTGPSSDRKAAEPTCPEETQLSASFGTDTLCSCVSVHRNLNSSLKSKHVRVPSATVHPTPDRTPPLCASKPLIRAKPQGENKGKLSGELLPSRLQSGTLRPPRTADTAPKCTLLYFIRYPSIKTLAPSPLAPQQCVLSLPSTARVKGPGGAELSPAQHTRDVTNPAASPGHPAAPAVARARRLCRSHRGRGHRL